MSHRNCNYFVSPVAPTRPRQQQLCEPMEKSCNITAIKPTEECRSPVKLHGPSITQVTAPMNRDTFYTYIQDVQHTTHRPPADLYHHSLKTNIHLFQSPISLGCMTLLVCECPCAFTRTSTCVWAINGSQVTHTSLSMDQEGTLYIHLPLALSLYFYLLRSPISVRYVEPRMWFQITWNP